MISEWLTLDQAAEYLQVTKPTLYRWMKQGKLPFYQPAGTGYRRFKRADLDALMVPGQVPTVEPDVSLDR